MKKFWLFFGLTLFLVCWGGGGYHGFGTCPAFGQSYYSAPYANPLSQLLYFMAPHQNQSYYQDNDREYRDRERQERQNQRYQRQESKREHRDRERQERDHRRYYP
jgi:hypothetical protein